MIKLVCDLNGGDNKASDLALGISKFLEEFSDCIVYAVGDIDISSTNNLKVIKTSEFISNEDDLLKSIINKKDASMIQAFNLVKEECDGIISVGSTKAFIVFSQIILKKLASKPALASLLPVKDKYLCLVDCGANLEVSSDNLVEFAKMGASYIEAFEELNNPSIAILSNGKEKTKGTPITQDAYDKLEQSNLNFKGFVEGTNMLSGEYDVVVSDGYTGNMALKTIEGTAKTIIKQVIKMNAPKEMIGNLLSYYDFNTLAGALLLGINKVCIKDHGSATSDTIYYTLKQAYKLVKNKLVDKININK